MSVKDFKAGMAAGAKPFGDKLDQLATANESGLSDITEGVDGIRAVVDTLLDDLSAQEKKKLYDLDEAMDLSVLEDDEQEFLVAVLATLANAISGVSDLQKKYLLGICNVTNIASPQTTLNLACIENIENMKTQKILLRYVMEFLFIGEQGYDFLDTYEDAVFCYFSVNKRGVAEIKDMINRIFNAMGVEGIANRYAFEPISEETDIAHDQPIAFIENGVDLRARAEAAYLKYNIEEALSFFNLLAEQGDSRSCYFLGTIYRSAYKGAVSFDYERAMSFWNCGLDAGDILCALRVAEETDDENEKSRIFDDAMDAAVVMAKNGDVYAMFEVARAYSMTNPNTHDIEKAMYWYAKASDAGFWAAMAGLGNRYKEQENYGEAVKHFQNAANCGYEYAMRYLADLYWFGDKVEENENYAISLYKQAAALGDANAMERLGDAYKFRKDWNNARQWYQQAIDHGETSCYLNLYESYFCGKTETYTNEINNEKIKIDNQEMGKAALLMGAICGNELSILELAGRALHGGVMSADLLNRLRKAGKFPLEHIVVNNVSFSTEQTIHKDLLNWAKEFLNEEAETGNPWAQYYLGVRFAKDYKDSKNPLDKKEAQRLLLSVIECLSEDPDKLGTLDRLILNDAKEVYQKLDKRFSTLWLSPMFMTGSCV